jgi:hypothetical protein
MDVYWQDHVVTSFSQKCKRISTNRFQIDVNINLKYFSTTCGFRKLYNGARRCYQTLCQNPTQCLNYLCVRVSA